MVYIEAQAPMGKGGVPMLNGLWNHPGPLRENPPHLLLCCLFFSLDFTPLGYSSVK